MKNEIKYYSSRSSNVITATNWKTLEVIKLYFENVKDFKTFNFIDRNNNKGLFLYEGRKVIAFI